MLQQGLPRWPKPDASPSASPSASRSPLPAVPTIPPSQKLPPLPIRVPPKPKGKQTPEEKHIARIEGWLNEANAHDIAGNLKRAKQGYLRVLDALPVADTPLHANGRAITLHLLGCVHHKEGRHGTAYDHIKEALEIAPSNARFRTDFGAVLTKLGLDDVAIRNFRSATEHDPSLLPAWHNLGVMLDKKGDIKGARTAHLKALALNPNDNETLCCLGTTYHAERDLEAAESFYRQALEVNPRDAQALYNLGVVEHDRGKCAEAIPLYNESLLCRPGYVLAHWNRALSRLAVGDWEGGWDDYEWRWKLEEQMRDVAIPGKRFNRPIWRGETGVRVHLHAEQGLGDTLMFCRYVEAVRDLGNKVVLEVQGGCVDLIRQSLRSAENLKIIPHASNWPGPAGLTEAWAEWGGDFEFHAPLMSLPRAFGTRPASIPWDGPYFRAESERAAAWATRLPKGVRVGICWGSGVRDTADPLVKRVGARKSMALRMFHPIAEAVHEAGGEVVSLQCGPWQSEIKEMGLTWLIHDEMSNEMSLADTAAVIENLDLVVCVDTAVGHLAGGMEKPCWVLELFDSCWRWLDKESTAWYPATRILRQHRIDDWHGVVAKTAEEVFKWVQWRKGNPSRPEETTSSS